MIKLTAGYRIVLILSFCFSATGDEIDDKYLRNLSKLKEIAYFSPQKLAILRKETKDEKVAFQKSFVSLPSSLEKVIEVIGYPESISIPSGYQDLTESPEVYWEYALDSKTRSVVRLNVSLAVDGQAVVKSLVFHCGNN